MSWVASEDEGIRAWRGYEIYVADHTLAGLDEAALAPFLQNEVPFTATPRTFRVGPLADGTPLRLGTLYYAHVRGTRAWDEVLERGAGSPEERAAPRPDWLEPRFTEIRFEGGAAALDLSAGRLHRIDPDHAADVAANDIYLGTSNAEDGAAPLTLKSISHLAYRDAAWGARRVELKRLGRDWTIAATTDDGWQDTVRVSVGQVYAIKTPEGNFAKLRVTAQTGTEPNRLVQVQWAYQLIPNFPAF